jgi:type II secretory pathway component GspD/PulD (secretin)
VATVKESNRSRIRTAWPLLWFIASAVCAQGTLEVLTLRHSTAEQVIPVLQPLLEPGGALSGQRNQLIVRTSPGNLAQIRAALDAIDRPQRRLTILVRFDSAQDAARRDVHGAARIASDGSSTSASAAVRIDNASSRVDERVDQRIQVLEGGRATIAAGQSRPLRVRQVIQTPSGPVVQETTEIAGAATGFDVVPRLAGAEVILEIAPQRENFVRGRSGAIQSERIESTARGRLGEWIELGGTSSSSARTERGMLSAGNRSVTGDRRVWVKVEETR